MYPIEISKENTNKNICRKNLNTQKTKCVKIKKEGKLIKKLQKIKQQQVFNSALYYSSKKIFISYNFIPPEQALWRAKLLQMLEDALSNSKKSEAKTFRAQANAWFFGSNTDYNEVCCLAGIDAQKFKKFVINKIRAKNSCIKL
jgi:hypothetical protein